MIQTDRIVGYLLAVLLVLLVVGTVLVRLH